MGIRGQARFGAHDLGSRLVSQRQVEPSVDLCLVDGGGAAEDSAQARELLNQGSGLGPAHSHGRGHGPQRRLGLNALGLGDGDLLYVAAGVDRGAVAGSSARHSPDGHVRVASASSFPEQRWQRAPIGSRITLTGASAR